MTARRPIANEFVNLIDAREVADKLGLKSPNTVLLWARQQRIPVVPVGRLRRFELAAVRAALAITDPWAPPPKGKQRGHS